MQDAVEQLRNEVRKLQLELRAMRSENKLLRQKLDAMARRMFGRKTEQLNPDQLELLLSGLDEEILSEEEPEPPSPNIVKRPRKPRSIRNTEHLQSVEEFIIPEKVKQNPEDWKEIDREILEQLDYKPGKFFKRLIIRPKYVHKTLRHLPPLIAPAPSKIIDRGLAAPGLLTQILTSRYGDHLPFHRQEDIFRRRYGIEIPRQLMVRWTQQCVGWLEGIHHCMRDEIRQSDYIQVDETPAKYLDKKLPNGSGKGYFWVYLKPGQQVVFDWHPGRSTECLRSFLGQRFDGHVQCDGYQVYQTYQKEQGEHFHLYACWSHVRRRFKEALDYDKRKAAWILGQIQKLYQWEKALRQTRAGPSYIQAIRASHHRMVVDRLFRCFEILKSKEKPSGKLAEAVSYALNQREYLERVLDSGMVQLDTNWVENSIRPLAVGRRNWLFIGEKEAGQRSAVMFSLVQTCRMLGVEPSQYLRETLETLPNLKSRDLANWTPYQWAKSRGLLNTRPTAIAA